MRRRKKRRRAARLQTQLAMMKRAPATSKEQPKKAT